MSAVENLRSQLGAALFERVAGPDGPAHRDRIHGREGARWFEPDSPIVRVHADASMFVGGLRALLLQTLHPAAMMAVHQHSGYRGDMWGRLNRTSHFLAVTTFGTADDAESAVRAVRRIHERIVGTMPDGSPYAASDPHLLEWVHVAEAASFLKAHEVYGAQQLTAEERDEYVAQVGQVGERLGVVDPPQTFQELQDRLAAFRPELRGTPEAREAVRHVLLRPPLPLPARPAYGVIGAAAVGLMPAWTRLPLRLPWLPVSERTTVRVLGGLATGTIRWAMTPAPSATA
ncbi:hypothetical protein ASD11_09850 [Aeromicrobium sp. Root495]|uniref:oxygenase MpaB family protein n=1 Tax=Aeromicrobium sp. Root495 TaxID=1736550 RepID=UPI0006FB7DFA|nr:oxygenase MpaB family protein [Aeromicrobium sp. Root495]KQY59819.1 hypothetical protein ASD11_09850 [Aeromicrobium sp. Root495]